MSNKLKALQDNKSKNKTVIDQQSVKNKLTLSQKNAKNVFFFLTKIVVMKRLQQNGFQSDRILALKMPCSLFLFFVTNIYFILFVQEDMRST